MPDKRATFVLVNARSLRNKTLLVRYYVDVCSLDVDAITETWLAEDEMTAVAKICGENFTFVQKPRGGACRSGDVGVLFRMTLQFLSCTDVDTHACETIGCIPRAIVVYRPPSSDFGSFLDDVGKMLIIAAAHPSETVVCGDFNIR